MDEDPIQKHPGLRPYLLSNVRLMGKFIGAGAYATVEEVIACPKATGQPKIGAAKRIHGFLQNPAILTANVVDRASMQFVKECNLLASLDHPNIVKFLGIYYFPDSRLPALVMERLLISLHDLLNPPADRPKYPFPLSMKCSILCDVADGLAYLHHGRSPPIIHGDLTAQNIVLNAELQAKLVDLGLSRIEPLMTAASRMTMPPGTLVYFPPENVRGILHDPSVDIFSFGVVTIFTIGETFPCDLQEPNYFDKETDVLVARTELQRRSEYMQQVRACDQLREGHPLILLIEQCLHNLPARRPSIREVLRLLGEAKAGIKDNQEIERSRMEQALRGELPRKNLQPVTTIPNLEKPYGIALRKSGEIVITEWGGDRVSILGNRGQTARMFGGRGEMPENMKYPAGVAVDQDDKYIYVSSEHKLQKFSSLGELKKCVGNEKGGKKGEFYEFDDPRGLAIYEDNLYVSDRNNHRIQVFDLDLNFVRSIGSHGKGTKEFNEPFDVKFDTSGNMYVAEFSNKRVQVIDSKTGKFVRFIGEEDANKVGLPTGLHIAKEYIFVSDLTHDCIVVYKTTGEFVTTIAYRGSRVGELCSPYCITSNEEKLFVCDSSNNRVQIFDFEKYLLW